MRNPAWLRKLSVNGFGLLLTGLILCVTVTTKFAEGGWVTLVVTLVFILFCQVVRSHYDRVQGALKSLDDTLLHSAVSTEPEGTRAV